MGIAVIGGAGFAVDGQASATLPDGAQLNGHPGCTAPHYRHREGQLGADLLGFLNANNERAADEFRHVHA